MFPTPPSPPGHGPSRRRTTAALVASLAALVAAVLGTDAALAGFSSTASAAHTAATAACFQRTTVQTGTTTSTANGTVTVTITSVDPTKAFLVFSMNSNLNRPVGSTVKGRLASATTLEFDRQTNESPVATINIRWDVIEYNCGVKVQRGSVVPSATSTNVTITAVTSLASSFVTYSKTPGSGTGTWSGNDPMVAELTTTTNLQLRVDVVDGSDVVWWQVVEFTDTTRIKVQKGTTSLASGTASTTASITAVDTTHTFVLASSRNNSPANDVGSGLVRARLTNSTTLTFDRSATNYAVSEIAWQVVELMDGSKVQHGSATTASGTASATATLTAVNVARTTAFASAQIGAGQSCGRSSYTADDIIGVACFTMSVTSSTQLTATRSNTSAAADVGWFVVTWGLP